MNKIALGVVMSTVAMAHSVASELTTTAEDQKSLYVTIYNSNVALIKDRRDISISKGEHTLAFKDVSASIKPQTSILVANGVDLLEQNFEYDLLSPETLLNKYVGKTVTIVQTNPATGDSSEKVATVLANNDGVMLKIGNQIQQLSNDMSVIYDNVPDNLRDKPTLTMLINKQEDSIDKQPVELTYLSDQLNWSADYVASLVDGKVLSLKGWVTLVNDSGTDYHNAQLQLVAGEVNRVHDDAVGASFTAQPQVMEMRVAKKAMQEESLFEYHLYSLGRPTTLKNNQQKQVSLLEAHNVPYHKRFVINATDNYGFRRWDDDSEYQSLSADVNITVDNKLANNLGMPLPAGVIRSYQKDSKNNMQFIGEDRIKHTPENDRIVLKLGEAFDVNAKRKQTDFQQTRTAQKNAVDTIRKDKITTSYEVVFNNAKDEETTVEYLENFFGEWTVTAQSLNSEKLNSTLNRWKVKIPAKGKITLTFTVEMVY